MPSCSCGKSFSAPGTLTLHKQSCEHTREKRNELLKRRASQPRQSRKKPRQETADPPETSSGAASSSVPSGPRSAPPDEFPDFDGTPMDVDEAAAVDVQADLLEDPSASGPAAPVPDSAPELPSTRRRTQHRVPAKFRDLEPEPLPRIVPPPSLVQRIVEQVAKPFATAVNKFGLFRIFQEKPSYDPEPVNIAPPPTLPAEPSWYPYPNRSAALFNDWFWNDGSVKSVDSRQTLLNLLLDPLFALDDLRGINWKRLDGELSGDIGNVGDGWRSETVYVKVPGGKGKEPITVPVEDFQYRPLIPLWKKEIETNPAAVHWTWTPSKLMHKSPDGQPTETAGEIYHSRRARRLYNEVQNLPRADGDDIERSVLFLMGGSDGTQLAQFGTASAWPGYMDAGNISMYVRLRRDARTQHHFASFPKVPDSVHDEIRKLNLPKTVKRNTLTHIRRELLHGCWRHILDDDFCHAYKNGFVVKCQDGVTRRIFPRFFSYTADYPEKMILATLRDKGNSPCPRCTVTMAEIRDLGTAADEQLRRDRERQHSNTWMRCVETAWCWITNGVCALKARQIEDKLGPQSWVPTINAFSVLKKAHSTFSVFSLMVVDFMHEIELGVWKRLLIHILRLLQAVKASLLDELDARFRQVPQFGKFSIRKFSNNVSELKQLAAHNFEDILQCAIPVFEGLFPEPYNTQILALLWIMAEWHALAKLRLHTATTIASLKEATTQLGTQLRDFVDTVCPAFKATELPRERAARARRKAKKAKKGSTATATTSSAPSDDSEPKEVVFNLETYKGHAIGDYPWTIEECGATDAYSTLLTENAHPELKDRYRRTNKHGAISQMADIERRQRNTRRIIQRAEGQYRSAAEAGIDEDAIDLSKPVDHLKVSLREKDAKEIGPWVHAHAGDPSVKDFATKLRDHLLNRLLKKDYDGDETTYSDAERTKLVIEKGKMYLHKKILINYTTYDVRRGQDIVHVGTPRCDIMLRACEDDSDGYPFWFARALGIYHVNACYTGGGAAVKPRPMFFLHVRWFARNLNADAPTNRARLTRLGWDTACEYGFVDPDHVLRACHLIPAFAHGKQAIPRTITNSATDEWKYHYAMRWSDRDLFMRYRGGGIGHVVSLAKPYNTDSTVHNGEQEEAEQPRERSGNDEGEMEPDWEIDDDGDDEDEDEGAGSDGEAQSDEDSDDGARDFDDSSDDGLGMEDDVNDLDFNE